MDLLLKIIGRRDFDDPSLPVGRTPSCIRDFTDSRLLPQNRQDPNWEIRKTKNWPKSSGFPNLDPPNLQILEPPGSCRLQDFLILAAGFANLEGPKSGNNWMLKCLGP